MDGSKVSGMTDVNFARMMKHFVEKIDLEESSNGSHLLKSYSPWLAEFQAINFETVRVFGLDKTFTRYFF